MLLIVLFSIIIGSLSVGYFLYQHLNEFLHERIEESLQKELSLIEYTLKKDKFLYDDKTYLKRFVNNYARILECRVTFIRDDGIVIADSEIPNDQLPNMENHITRPEVQEAMQLEFGSHIRLSASVGQNLF